MATPSKTPTTRKRTTPKPETAEAPAPAKETVSQLRNRLRNEAERTVINNHKDEFVQVATALFAKHGMEFNRRLTDKEKAAKAIEDQLNQFPELRALFTQQAEQQQAQAQYPFTEDYKPVTRETIETGPEFEDREG